MRLFSIFLGLLFAAASLFPVQAFEPKRIIFDSDMGSDVDDGLALAELHALANRGEVEILALTSSNACGLVPRYLRMLNTYHGRASLPVGMPDLPANDLPSNHMEPTLNQLESVIVSHPESPAPFEPALPLLRKTLAESPDSSVIIIMTGFATNLARLLDSPADAVSSLTGRELLAQKVSLLICVAGGFIDDMKDKCENNIRFDISAARRVAADWPTPIIWSGAENGRRMVFSRESLDHTFAEMPNEPAYVSCVHYGIPYMAQWDLLPALYITHPEYFRLSEPGHVIISEEGLCSFEPDPNGRDRHIIFLNDEESARVTEAYRWLVSEPPCH